MLLQGKTALVYGAPVARSAQPSLAPMPAKVPSSIYWGAPKPASTPQLGKSAQRVALHMSPHSTPSIKTPSNDTLPRSLPTRH